MTTERAGRLAAPEPLTAAATCADLGARRVCWEAGGPRLVARVLPAGAAPPDGYRCGGAGSARVCEDRSRNAGRFSCGQQRCLQARPRQPDDGEWECVEMAGIGFCHARGPMAGASAGPDDLGWLCGQRRGGAPGERICLDLDPDRPSPDAHYACRYEQQPGQAARSCVISQAPSAGSACGPETRCPAGTTCQLALCLPARPEPACWLDGDCAAAQRCVLGTCTGSGA